MQTVRLRNQVRPDARYSFASIYRWLRASGMSRQRVLAILRADKSLCW
jgi:hypothetical protein